MLINKTVGSFLAELKSDLSAPGGGSVAALAGALAAALGIMVGNLTMSSAKCAAAHGKASALNRELETALVRLSRYVDEDSDAFNEVITAYKLPKDSDADKAIRNQAIQTGLRLATQLPLAVAETCVAVLALSNKIMVIGNANAASDAAVAGRMAHAGAWSALYNVRINLASINDQQFVAERSVQVKTLASQADQALAELSRIFETMI